MTDTKFNLIDKREIRSPNGKDNVYDKIANEFLAKY